MTITPRTLKGFRDYLPEAMIPRERLMETARRVYRSFGYSPIDTPALEYAEILRGKQGGEEEAAAGEEAARQMYQFADQGGRQVGMRFDLTVPLARFVAQHAADLPMPFKRYHIAAVWRGEKSQRGRYREFLQCDFDCVGSYSSAADVETALVIHDLLNAIGFERFTIRVNNRLVLSGVLESLGLADRTAPILRSLDKLPKIGRDKVAEEIVGAAGATPGQAKEVLKLAEIGGGTDSVLRQLAPLVAGSERGELGLAKLAEMSAAVDAAGVPPQRFAIDVSIARGLDYYTGAVFETFLDDLPGIGSVCSGGRYDNLAGLYTRQELPGVGASLGLDRLLAAMEELKMVKAVGTPAAVFIPYFDEGRLADYLKLAAALRRAGIGVEVFPDSKKLGGQLKYADRRGFRAALIAGSRELDAGICQVKDLSSGSRRDVALDEDYASIVAAVGEILR